MPCSPAIAWAVRGGSPDPQRPAPPGRRRRAPYREPWLSRLRFRLSAAAGSPFGRIGSRRRSALPRAPGRWLQIARARDTAQPARARPRSAAKSEERRRKARRHKARRLGVDSEPTRSRLSESAFRVGFPGRPQPRHGPVTAPSRPRRARAPRVRAHQPARFRALSRAFFARFRGCTRRRPRHSGPAGPRRHTPPPPPLPGARLSTSSPRAPSPRNTPSVTAAVAVTAPTVTKTTVAVTVAAAAVSVAAAAMTVTAAADVTVTAAADVTVTAADVNVTAAAATVT